MLSDGLKRVLCFYVLEEFPQNTKKQDCSERQRFVDAIRRIYQDANRNGEKECWEAQNVPDELCRQGSFGRQTVRVTARIHLSGSRFVTAQSALKVGLERI
jgi:hypothetical protein